MCASMLTPLVTAWLGIPKKCRVGWISKATSFPYVSTCLQKPEILVFFGIYIIFIYDIYILYLYISFASVSILWPKEKAKRAFDAIRTENSVRPLALGCWCNFVPLKAIRWCRAPAASSWAFFQLVFWDAFLFLLEVGHLSECFQLSFLNWNFTLPENETASLHLQF